MFAVWPVTGTRASVVVATDPELIDTLAYGDVVPTPTRSVVVASFTMFGASDAHPPPTDAPPPVMVPQDTKPDPSDCKA